MPSDQQLIKTIAIHAPARSVWEVLTNPEMMKRWIAEPEMEIDILTDWRVGHPIVIKGFHHVHFQNTGTVLEVQPNHVLRYSYLSSLSRLQDIAQSYTEVAFRLTPNRPTTTLTLTLTNFPTPTIYHHLDFYWNGTLEILKKFVEKQ